MGNCGCSCGKKVGLQIVYACSGAADVGELSDGVARRLAKTSSVKMSCLAGVGGNIPDYLDMAKKAAEIIVIDGCPTECAKNVLLEKGFKCFRHFRVTDFGFEKGKTMVNHETVRKVLSGIEA